MPPHAIRVQGLGKQFRAGETRTSFPTLRDALTGSARRVLAALRAPSRRRRDAELFWALRDVSFDVAQGEVVGIIGGNGAGKSTLLKVLSHITEPTEGRVEVTGRVGSLLEVGTGFHPELSGRENVFLNGAILGMPRRNIAARFDDIVGFAEVERFIDMPVKHYSSGMYLRLAFAVAAHLEPEILIVDEVLAVGDAAFQKKCLGKMNDVAHEGRTVIFVSHNLDAVERLCTRCVLMEHGRVGLAGRTRDVVQRYVTRASAAGHPGVWIEQGDAGRDGSGEVRIVAVRHAGGGGGFGVVTGEPWEVCCTVASDAPRQLSSFAVTVSNRSGAVLINADTVELGKAIVVSRGPTTIGIRIDHLHLNPGRYVVGLWIGDLAGHAVDHIPAAFELDVTLLRDQAFGISAQGVVACSFDILPAAYLDTIADDTA